MPNPADIVVRTRGLVCRFGTRTVLDGVDLDVRRGEVLVILGGSGCGKSTLLRHGVGLQRPTEGTVELFGRDLWAGDEDERDARLRRVGILFQSSGLFNSISLGDNVAFPLRERGGIPEPVIRAVVRRTLDLVGLADAAERMPSQLSGGMKKRGGLARAMALDPEIIFCDEPSAGLDPNSAASLDELILSLKKRLGTTFVVVTHELPSMHKIADRIVMLRDGRVAARGTKDQIIADPDPWVQDFLNRVPAGVA